MSEIEPGVRLYRGYFDEAAQRALLRELESVIAAAPLLTPTMPRSGLPFSVRTTNCGPLGWLSDQARGYHYEARHPETGEPWPPMPRMLLDAWEKLADYPIRQRPASSISMRPRRAWGRIRIGRGGFLGSDLSVSLGANCQFRLGGVKRSDSSRVFALSSGDVLTLGGPARLRFHGVDRLLPELAPKLSSPLFAAGGRINLTLRRVT